MKHCTTRTRIKICGLTREEDVQAACEFGADALGFVFYPKSKRCVTAKRAGELARFRSVFVNSVALFVEPDDALVQSVIHEMRPDLLQFHGDETSQACERFDWPYIKAFRVGAPGLDTPEGLLAACQRFGNAKAWLFDSYTPAYGGSGHGFDRGLLSAVLAQRSVPIILSGGLNTETVGPLIHQLEPDALDVSSGVETEPGIKDASKIQSFVRAIREADANGDFAVLHR